MLCRFSRLSAICTIAVCCSTGYAGLWDAPPQSNADFGSGTSNPNPSAFKSIPPEADKSETVPASCACDNHAGGYTASPAFVPSGPAYPMTQSMPMVQTMPMQSMPMQTMQSAPMVQSAPIMEQGPMMQGPVVQQQVIPQQTLAPAPQMMVAPQYVQAPMMAAPAYTPAINPMGLAQQTYSGGGPGAQWGLFRPRVSAGGAWGGRRRFYAGSEFLFFKTRGQRLPALVTRSPEGTPIEEAGRLDYPDTTTVLFGGSRLGSNEHNGFRSYIGMNLDCAGRTRIEADYFDLNRERFFYAQETPTDAVILGRPFYNTYLGTEDAEIVGYPAQIEGRITVAGSTEFSGLGVGLRHSLLRCFPQTPAPQPVCDPCGGSGMIAGGPCGGGGMLGGYGGGAYGGGRGTSACGPGAAGLASVGYGAGGYGLGGAGVGGAGIGASLYGTGGGLTSPRWRLNRMDFLAGYRRYELEEDIAIREYLRYVRTDGQIPFGTEFDILDQFRTENRFDGADFGVDWEWVRGRLGVSAMGKVAIGNMRQRAYIDGQTTISAPNEAAVSYPYGLYALSSNSGNYDRNRFTVIPEIGLDVYFQVSCNARVRVGYSMIYLPNVIRPGGLIDPNLDPRLFPPQTIAGGAFPAFKFCDEDFWVQGLRLGMEYCF